MTNIEQVQVLRRKIEADRDDVLNKMNAAANKSASEPLANDDYLMCKGAYNVLSSVLLFPELSL